MVDSSTFAISFAFILISNSIVSTDFVLFVVAVTIIVFAVAVESDESTVTVGLTRVGVFFTIISADWLNNQRTVTPSADSVIINLNILASGHAWVVVGFTVIPASWSIVSSITITILKFIVIRFLRVDVSSHKNNANTC